MSHGQYCWESLPGSGCRLRRTGAPSGGSGAKRGRAGGSSKGGGGAGAASSPATRKPGISAWVTSPVLSPVLSPGASPALSPAPAPSGSSPAPSRSAGSAGPGGSAGGVGRVSSSASRTVNSGTCGRTTVSWPPLTSREVIDSCRPVGSPTNSASTARNASAAMVPQPGWGLSTSSQRASRSRGMPARTWRGRSTRPWSVGAGGTAELEGPAQRPVRAAYSRPARSATSSAARPVGRPCSAASTHQPMTRTAPEVSMRTFSGLSRPCGTSAACARAQAAATSPTTQAARRGLSSPPAASMMSSEVPDPHSLTT